MKIQEPAEPESMTFVEFVGVPGSGKSTLMASVVSELRSKQSDSFLTADDALFEAAKLGIDKTFKIPLNVLPRTLAKKLFTKIGNRSYWQQRGQVAFFAKHDQTLKDILASEQFRSLSVSEKEIVLSGFQQAGGIHECLQSLSANNHYVFFDEGLLQKSMMFVSPTSTNMDTSVLARYLSSVSLPDIVVFLDLDIATCRDRMMDRSKGLIRRLKGCTQSEIEIFLNNTVIHWQYIVDRLCREALTKVVTVSSEAELGLTTSDVAAYIIKDVGKNNKESE